MPVLATNKFARSDYEILETVQAGLKLLGAEVKSAKLGHIHLKGSYVSAQDNALWLMQAQISPYAPAAGNPVSAFDPKRPRKLLLTRRQMDAFDGKVRSSNLTIIPLKVYTKSGFVKVDVAIARGRKKYDKREVLKKRDLDRTIRRTLKYR